MKYYIEREEASSYSVSRYLRFISPSNLEHELLMGECYAVVKTAINRTWRAPRHIVVLDCDNSNDMLAAVAWLSTELETGYAIIQSSHDRYWVLLDKTYSTTGMLTTVRETPGVDPKAVGLIAGRGFIYLRAVPKIIDGYTILPSFPAEHTLCDPVTVKWYNGLKSHFESDMMVRVAKNWSLRSGRVLEMAASPDFGLLPTDVNDI